MKAFFYRFLMALSRRTGTFVFLIFAWFVATGYFFLFPSRRAVSVRFYRALFPGRSRLHHLRCAWRQYHRFTTVYLDRFQLRSYDETRIDSEGFERLQEVLALGKGAIVLMSHMGNWEVAAHWMKQKGIQLLLYVGKKYEEQIEGMQKDSLRQAGVQLVAVDQEGGSPFDLLEGINFLKAGGVVSMTGDRIWSSEQRSIPVRFLGHEALLPESPHLFALLTGAPILIFFGFRLGSGKYRMIMLPPRYVAASSRAGRREAIQASAQWYAGQLEAMARQHPFEWYHFEPFLGEKR